MYHKTLLAQTAEALYEGIALDDSVDNLCAKTLTDMRQTPADVLREFLITERQQEF
ncbi:hypothetical protein METH_04065 [Leisingera methylohalidivorans DSM 14336]|uniref:Uncharacterized protein n=1 Tax=Leisingera methylohalidivorans DSM 14336 TaxID=999552 RepID=V9VYR1_9RHOB|nr:hypothetical protein METH_04065 [Leisingera methylohalidivorans DSM 14336]